MLQVALVDVVVPRFVGGEAKDLVDGQVAHPGDLGAERSGDVGCEHHVGEVPQRGRGRQGLRVGRVDEGAQPARRAGYYNAARRTPSVSVVVCA